MIEDVDFGTSGFWTWDEGMWEHFREMRRDHPVFWSDKTGAYILTRYEEVRGVSKDHHTFCSGMGVLPNNPAKLGLIDEDDPRHMELRGLVNKGFTPRMVNLLEGFFENVTREAIDKVAPTGKCDLVHDVAVPLPLATIAKMLGIRQEDYETFNRWSDDMILAYGNLSDPGVAHKAGVAYIEYASYVNDVIEDRRKNPQDDIMSILVQAKDSGVLGTTAHDRDNYVFEEQRQLSNDELITFAVLLLVAGNETTRNSISGTTQLLIENPEARQRLIDDPELIPNAMEETLRLVSPVLGFLRTATKDTEILGTKIESGKPVFIIYPSANRDETEFENPDTLDIERNPTHLAFGIGNHFCLGANLARMQLRIAMREILRRMPDARYADGGPVMAPSPLVRSFMTMNLEFTPEAGNA